MKSAKDIEVGNFLDNDVLSSLNNYIRDLFMNDLPNRVEI